MKKICENCAYFECVDNDGEFLEKGFCWLLPLYTDVDDDHTCEDFVADQGRLRDIKDGM